MSISIIGTWRLVRVEAVNGDGEPLPPPYGGAQAMGLLTFNVDGRMMAVLCDGRPALRAGEVREYNSYCGNYTFDGQQLITKVDASTSAIRPGSEQVRDVTTESDLMVLRPPQRVHDKGVEQRTLYWEKLSEL